MSDSYGQIIGDAAADFAMISQSGRSIGGIIPFVVMEEMHRDELVATIHPVETGTPITDHAFLLPQIVEMRCGWTDTGLGPGYVQTIYEQLLALQQSREPFDVTTGKRQYSNMLIRALAVKTDVESENALMVIATLQQVILADVTTSNSGTSPNSNGSSVIGNAENGQANPTTASASDIAAANAAAAGFPVDSNGNVSFPVSGSPMGVNLLAMTNSAPTISQVQTAYSP